MAERAPNGAWENFAWWVRFLGGFLAVVSAVGGAAYGVGSWALSRISSSQHSADIIEVRNEIKSSREESLKQRQETLDEIRRQHSELRQDIRGLVERVDRLSGRRRGKD